MLVDRLRKFIWMFLTGVKSHKLVMVIAFLWLMLSFWMLSDLCHCYLKQKMKQPEVSVKFFFFLNLKIITDMDFLIPKKILIRCNNSELKNIELSWEIKKFKKSGLHKTINADRYLKFVKNLFWKYFILRDITFLYIFFFLISRLSQATFRIQLVWTFVCFKPTFGLQYRWYQHRKHSETIGNLCQFLWENPTWRLQGRLFGLNLQGLAAAPLHLERTEGHPINPVCVRAQMGPRGPVGVQWWSWWSWYSPPSCSSR